MFMPTQDPVSGVDPLWVANGFLSGDMTNAIDNGSGTLNDDAANWLDATALDGGTGLGRYRSGSNFIVGWGGVDTMIGGSGNDTIVLTGSLRSTAGTGNDSIDGGAGYNTLVLYGTAGDCRFRQH
jgi:Ca2+-binding RTX toxin-like protein